MVVFVIFWAALFAIFCFVFAVLFKLMASAFSALLSSAIQTFTIGGAIGLGGIGLFLLYKIVHGIIKNGIWGVIGTIVIFIVLGAIVGGFFTGIGLEILGIVVVIFETIISFISEILEHLSTLFGEGYIYFLTIIIKYVEKC